MLGLRELLQERKRVVPGLRELGLRGRRNQESKIVRGALERRATDEVLRLVRGVPHEDHALISVDDGLPLRTCGTTRVSIIRSRGNDGTHGGGESIEETTHGLHSTSGVTTADSLEPVAEDMERIAQARIAGLCSGPESPTIEAVHAEIRLAPTLLDRPFDLLEGPSNSPSLTSRMSALCQSSSA